MLDIQISKPYKHMSVIRFLVTDTHLVPLPTVHSGPSLAQTTSGDVSRLDDVGVVTQNNSTIPPDTSYWIWGSCSFSSHCVATVGPIFTQGCHSMFLSLSFCSSFLSLVPGRCLCSHVLCDNTGNNCGKSPNVTVILVTPLSKSPEVNINRKSLIISFSLWF